MEILFSLKNIPTNNFLGTDGSGQAVTLFRNGIVWYERVMCGVKEPLSRDEYGPFPALALEVSAIIEEYATDIASLPDFIDQDCCDGSWQYFQFKNRKIIVDNMSYYRPEDWETLFLLHDDDEIEAIRITAQQVHKLYEIYRKIYYTFNRLFQQG